MIRPSTYEDVYALAETMREDDKREARSLAGCSPFEALSIGLMNSTDCITAETPDGDVVMMAGVVGNPGDTGLIWMLSSDLIANYRRDLVKLGKQWIEDMTAKYGALANVVDARNEVHVSLIRFFGFTFGDPIDNSGVEGVRVIPFERRT